MQRFKFSETAVLFMTFCVFLTFVSCSSGSDHENIREPYTYMIPEQTGDGWETTHMVDVGIDPSPLMGMMDHYFGGHQRDVHAMLIIKSRKLVFEEYWGGFDFGPPENNWRGEYLNFDRDTLHCLHSATKSFTSALLGMAIDHHYVPDEFQRIFAFFPDYAHLNNSGKNQILLKHTLTMTSGLEWNEGDVPLTDISNDLRQILLTDDPIGYILAKPLAHQPGTFYYYSGGDTNLVGDVVRRSTGMNIDTFSRSTLFNELGITNFRWTYFPKAPEIVYCSGDLYLRPRDMAKFGQLFLDRGVWMGKRLISDTWIRKSTVESVSLAGSGIMDADAYGYQWWILDYTVNDRNIHSYSARGWGGQLIIVLPELDSVLVFTGGNYTTFSPVHHIVRAYILPAML